MTHDTELFELCKEVYKRFPEWFRTRDKFNKDGKVMIGPFYALRPASTQTPLYTSDYLLEKLPPTILARGNAFSTATRIAATSKQLIGVEASTPLKALLKLTIALHKAGHLNSPEIPDSSNVSREDI